MLGINMTQNKNFIFDNLIYYVRIKKLIIIWSVFVCQWASLRLSVSARHRPSSQRREYSHWRSNSLSVEESRPIFLLPLWLLVIHVCTCDTGIIVFAEERYKKQNVKVTAGRRLNWSGTSSEKSTCRVTIRPWNGKEKVERHDLSAMLPCDN